MWPKAARKKERKPASLSTLEQFVYGLATLFHIQYEATNYSIRRVATIVKFLITLLRYHQIIVFCHPANSKRVVPPATNKATTIFDVDNDAGSWCTCPTLFWLVFILASQLLQLHYIAFRLSLQSPSLHRLSLHPCAATSPLHAPAPLSLLASHLLALYWPATASMWDLTPNSQPGPKFICVC